MIAEQNEDAAVTRFKISLQKTNLICNCIAKKTLLRMHEIFMGRSDKFLESHNEKARHQRQSIRNKNQQRVSLKKQ